MAFKDFTKTKKIKNKFVTMPDFRSDHTKIGRYTLSNISKASKTTFT